MVPSATREHLLHMSKPNGVVRLTESQLVALENKCRSLMVTANSSQLEVAHALGQQSVLKMLRDGFTIGT